MEVTEMEDLIRAGMNLGRYVLQDEQQAESEHARDKQDLVNRLNQTLEELEAVQLALYEIRAEKNAQVDTAKLA